MRARTILRPTVAAAALLLIPLTAMLLDGGVDWTPFDFLAAGALLFGAGLAFELTAGRARDRRERVLRRAAGRVGAAVPVGGRRKGRRIMLTMAAAILLAAAAASAPAAPAAIPPPVYDFCELAVQVQTDAQGEAVYEGTTCDGENLVVDHDCGDWVQTYGSDDHYAVTLAPGGTLIASVQPDGDAMLMVAAECVVYGTMFTCLAAVDAEGSGGAEALAFANDAAAARTVYLVVDAERIEDCGSYVLEITVGEPVAAAAASWGAVKRAWR